VTWSYRAANDSDPELGWDLYDGDLLLGELLEEEDADLVVEAVNAWLADPFQSTLRAGGRWRVKGG
jgi:hypothetical protein